MAPAFRGVRRAILHTGGGTLCPCPICSTSPPWPVPAGASDGERTSSHGSGVCPRVPSSLSDRTGQHDQQARPRVLHGRPENLGRDRTAEECHHPSPRRRLPWRHRGTVQRQVWHPVYAFLGDVHARSSSATLTLRLPIRDRHANEYGNGSDAILDTVHSGRCPREVNKECWFAVYAFDRVENPHRQVHSRSMGRRAGVSKLRRQTQGVLQVGFPHHRSIARGHRSEYPQAKDVLRKQEMGSKLKSRPFGTQTLGLPCSGGDAQGGSMMQMDSDTLECRTRTAPLS